MEHDDLIMLSSLQHYIFCPRQCALIHVEQSWNENYLTATGRIQHEHVDKTASESRKDICQATSLRLTSLRLGLTGVADMVEFHRIVEDENCQDYAVPLEGKKGLWRPVPVEYKRGKPKEHQADEIQLCAQSICLEEMLSTRIPVGLLFYSSIRRRVEVEFTDDLRAKTEVTVKAVRELINSGITPPAQYSKSCEACSLIEECQPKVLNKCFSIHNWLDKNIEDMLI